MQSLPEHRDPEKPLGRLRVLVSLTEMRRNTAMSPDAGKTVLRPQLANLAMREIPLRGPTPARLPFATNLVSSQPGLRLSPEPHRARKRAQFRKSDHDRKIGLLLR